MTLEPTDHTQCQPPTSGGCQHGDPHCPARNAVDVTLTHEQIMARHVPRTAVPIEQCIELINAALDYRTAQQAMHDAHNALTKPSITEYEALADTYEQAHDRLHEVIRALPERP